MNQNRANPWSQRFSCFAGTMRYLYLYTPCWERNRYEDEPQNRRMTERVAEGGFYLIKNFHTNISNMNINTKNIIQKYPLSPYIISLSSIAIIKS